MRLDRFEGLLELGSFMMIDSCRLINLSSMVPRGRWMGYQYKKFLMLEELEGEGIRLVKLMRSFLCLGREEEDQATDWHGLIRQIKQRTLYSFVWISYEH